MKRELYFKNVMDEIDYNQMKQIFNVNELLDLMKDYRDIIAIEGPGYSKTYHELLFDVSQARTYFAENNYLPGDHIGIILRNEYDFVRIFLAVTSLGMTAVILPTHLLQKNLGDIYNQMDLKLIVHGIDQDIFVGINKVNGINKMLVTSNNITPPSKVVKKDLPAAIIFTSGTTSKPRGAVLSHGNLMRGTINGTYSYGKSYYQRYYAIIPFSHVFGLIRSCLTPLYSGGTIAMCEEMSDLVKDFGKARPSILILVPALAEMIYELIKMRGIDIVGGNLHTIICGGADVSPKLIKDFLEFDIILLPGYGLTESSNLVSGAAKPLTNSHTVGMPYPLMDTLVVEGELWIRGDAVMLGYYKDEKANQDVFVDGWFRTGDLVRFDEEGLLYITGRLKNIIVLSNGENVSPEMLESKLKELVYVKDSVISSKKAGLGEIIVVEVFFDEQMVNRLKIDNVRERFDHDVKIINESNPKYMQIRRVTIREQDFPRSSNLKIIRSESI